MDSLRMFSILLIVSVTSIAFLHIKAIDGCKSFIFQNDQSQVCTTLKPPVSLVETASYYAVPKVSLPSPDTLRRLVCDINISQEMDLMKMKMPQFIKRFKNPCWYEGENMRCLPYVHLVGTAKSGTTDFFERISRHPDFVKPTRKEPSWLSSGRFSVRSLWIKLRGSNQREKRIEDTGMVSHPENTKIYNTSCEYTPDYTYKSVNLMCTKGSDYEVIAISRTSFMKQESFTFYTTNFFSPIAERQSNINGSSNLITGDASVFDLHGGVYWPFLGKNVGHDAPVENNPEYIYHLNRQARIIIIVRNPIDRLWSEYLAMSRTGNISAESFHEVVLNAVGMYKACLQSRSLRSCMYGEPLSRYASMTEDERKYFDRIENCRYSGYQMVTLLRGVYHVFIRDYLRVFPRDQVLILRTEDISKNMKKNLLQTFQFLGLERPNETVFNSMLYSGRHNARRPSNLEKGNMLDATRRILYDFYRSHNHQLATMLGDSNYNYGLSGQNTQK